MLLTHNRMIFTRIRGTKLYSVLNVNNSPSAKHQISPENLKITHSTSVESAPSLQYGLERILFNQGVNWLMDSRTNVYNFDPILHRIPTIEQFKHDSIPPFISASQDTSLHSKALNEGMKFVSSTSSISQSMSSIFFVLTRMQPLHLESLSSAFADEPKSFTALSRSPNAVILQPHGPNLRSIVVEKKKERTNVLQTLGHVLERLLTEPKSNFCRMLVNSKERPNVKSIESYSYASVGKILLRSQLDCQDQRLPLKTFDLKTRAVLPIRMDIYNYQNYLNYRITSPFGLYGSFEREYYDMCRSTLLKYNFQVRIGNMDGIFVAYHNTAEIFGFQYLNRNQMDSHIYGNSTTGDAAFNIICQVYNKILEEIVPQYPKTSLIRLTFAPDRQGLRLAIFAEDIGNNPDTTVGKNLKYFTVTLNSFLNGHRTDQVILRPDGKDKWTVTMNISEKDFSRPEFDAARQKATLIRADSEESPDMPILNDIKSLLKKPSNTHNVSNPIIPNWVF